MSAKSYLQEMEQEFVSTRNLLEALPEDRMAFKPHEKAMSLGQLALHVATIPGRNLGFAKDGKVETSIIVLHPYPQSKEEILSSLEQSIQTVRTLLDTDNTTWLKESWNLMRENASIAEMPTYAFVRTFVLNHWYHHRGELATYLRMINVKLPSIYGPTADVDPFA